jgi:hypothetical protein
MITKEILDQLRSVQQKNGYGSQAQSMFVNGVFSSDNWNGGDGLIRQYFSTYEGKVHQDTLVDYIEFTYKDTHFWGDIIVTHTWFDDQNYATVTFSGTVEINDELVFEKFEDVVYFTWYKNRGRTEKAKYNGLLMTEEQYLFVLNALEQTGFKFDLT